MSDVFNQLIFDSARVPFLPRSLEEPTGRYPAFGRAVRDLVGSLSTRQVSNKTGGLVSASTVARAANGERIDAEKIDILARAFKRSPNDLRPLADYPLIAESPADLVANEPAVSPEMAQILEYIEDPETRAAVRYFHGLPPEMRGPALASLAGMAKYKDAAEIARELEEEATFGKRSDRAERPSQR